VIAGATDGGRMVFGIVTLLVAALGLVGLLNLVLSVFGFLHLEGGLTLQKILGWIFTPFTYFIGLTPADVPAVARLIGERSVVTEVGAYGDLAQLMQAGAISERSGILATYALCGFVHIASLGIYIGGISALASGRVKDLAAVGFRAFIAATLSLMMVAAAAGVFLGK